MLRNIIKQMLFQQKPMISIRTKTSAVTEQTLEELSALESAEVYEEDDQLREAEIERKRNKSRLQTQHFNILHEKMAFPEPINEWHHTVKYQQKMYGRYGKSSGVQPALLFPTKEAIEERQEYEKIAFPYTIEEMMSQVNEKRRAADDAQSQRQQDIVKKYAKLEQWKTDLRQKIAKRESEALAAKARKDRLVEEVRRHFGFKIDPRDERFKEMLEQKERAEKKAMKEARRKVKEEKLIAKLQESQSGSTTGEQSRVEIGEKV